MKQLVGSFALALSFFACLACSKSSAPRDTEATATPAAEAPSSAEASSSPTEASCLALLQGDLELAEAEPVADREVERSEFERVTETVSAEVLELRGPGATTHLCVANKQRDTWTCRDEVPACNDEEDHSSTTEQVIAAVTADGKSVVDKVSFESSQEFDSGKTVSFTVTPVGPAVDVLAVVERYESGDTGYGATTWLGFDGRKLVRQLQWGSGVVGGMPVAEVEQRMTDELDGGRFVVHFEVETFEEGDAPVSRNGACRWSDGAYDCPEGLLEGTVSDEPM